MRIVQSFWSCHQENLLKFNGGWFSPEYNLMSWALSCLQLKQFYPDVTLYADNVSAKMLIDTLKLPYDNLKCDLNCLDNYHSQLWALPKVHAYSKQQSPFLHVDGDVFIWKKFDERLLQSKLIAQNEESATSYYESILQSLEAELSYFPIEIVAERKLNNPVHAYNAGVLGGHDIEFFRDYALKAFQFIDNNISNLYRINVSNFNIFFEQYLFYCLVRSQKKQVSVLIDKVFGDNEYTGLGEFIDVPHSKQYLHLLGDYKRNEKVCEQMAHRLRENYPEFYYRIIEVFNKGKVPVINNYYWFEQDISEQNLLAKHYSLKKLYLSNELQVVESRSIPPISSYEPIYYRVSQLKSVFKTINEGKPIEVLPEKMNWYLEDINKFENALFEIVTEEFRFISKKYLLGRDICSAQYAQYIFANPSFITEKVIERDCSVKILESKFDWTILKDTTSTYTNISKLLEQEPAEIFTLVVPECDEKGFSLVNIDILDILILNVIKERKAIAELFEQLKLSFEAEDLEESKVEFEILILGRIKKGLQNKSIKAILTLSA